MQDSGDKRAICVLNYDSGLDKVPAESAVPEWGTLVSIGAPNTENAKIRCWLVYDAIP